MSRKSNTHYIETVPGEHLCKTTRFVHVTSAYLTFPEGAEGRKCSATITLRDPDNEIRIKTQKVQFEIPSGQMVSALTLFGAAFQDYDILTGWIVTEIRNGFVFPDDARDLGGHHVEFGVTTMPQVSVPVNLTHLTPTRQTNTCVRHSDTVKQAVRLSPGDREMTLMHGFIFPLSDICEDYMPDLQAGDFLSFEVTYQRGIGAYDEEADIASMSSVARYVIEVPEDAEGAYYRLDLLTPSGSSVRPILEPVEIRCIDSVHHRLFAPSKEVRHYEDGSIVESEYGIDGRDQFSISGMSYSPSNMMGAGTLSVVFDNVSGFALDEGLSKIEVKGAFHTDRRSQSVSAVVLVPEGVIDSRKGARPSIVADDSLRRRYNAGYGFLPEGRVYSAQVLPTADMILRLFDNDGNEHFHEIKADDPHSKAVNLLYNRNGCFTSARLEVPSELHATMDRQIVLAVSGNEQLEFGEVLTGVVQSVLNANQG